MLNGIFLVLIAGAVLTAAFNGSMPRVTEQSLGAARAAVDLAVGLIGQMSLWLGFMAVLRDAGLMRSLARALKPVMVRLFPQVPAEHPAMGAMIMNIAANMLGLGNAATPFGLKAMRELSRLNTHPGVATNAMVLFLAINTSGVAVLPLGVVAVRATLGSTDPAGIVIPSLLATAASTVVAVLLAKFLERRSAFRPEKYVEPGAAGGAAVPEEDVAGLAEAQKVAAVETQGGGWRRLLVAAAGLVLAFALVRHVVSTAGELGAFGAVRGVFSDWLLPVLMAGIVLFGFGRRVKVYESFVAGAKEGFQIAVMVIPFLVAILVAIAMFRASGAMEALVGVLSPVTAALGFPAEALPMALIRPLSGSGALGVMTESMKTHGPDSFVGYLVSILNGSTETTFYVLAVYLGSVQVRASRHAVAACLGADLTGICAATALAHLFFG